MENTITDLFGSQITAEEYYKIIYAKLYKMVKDKKALFIPRNTPSLKNSKEIFQMYTGKSDCCKAEYTKLGPKQYVCKKCAKSCQLGTRPVLVSSKAVKEYTELTQEHYLQVKVDIKPIIKGWPKPLKLGLFFIRGSEHEFDYSNAQQVIEDLFTHNQIIPDDNMKELMIFPLGYIVYPKYPGVIIVPMNNFPKYEFD